MDQGAWWATIHGVAKSRTRLRDFCVCVCMCQELCLFLEIHNWINKAFESITLLSEKCVRKMKVLAMRIRSIKCLCHDFSVEKHLICVFKNWQEFRKNNIQNGPSKEENIQTGGKCVLNLGTDWLENAWRWEAEGNGAVMVGRGLFTNVLKVIQMILDIFSWTSG